MMDATEITTNIHKKARMNDEDVQEETDIVKMVRF